MAKSLAAQTGSLAVPGLTLPPVFQAPLVPVEAKKWSPYLVYAHNKRSDEFARIRAKLGSVEEGELYFVDGDDIRRMQQCKIGWLTHRQYWAAANAAGEVLSTSFKEMPKPYKEHIEAVVLVYLDDRISPANVQFRSTKCPVAKAMYDALELCSKPDWGNLSEAHKHSMVCTQPFMRFYGVFELGPQRTSKSTGLPYRSNVTRIHPTTTVEWAALKKFCDDPETQKRLDDAARTFEFRVREVTDKEGKPPAK